MLLPSHSNETSARKHANLESTKDSSYINTFLRKNKDYTLPYRSASQRKEGSWKEVRKAPNFINFYSTTFWTEHPKEI